MKKTALRIKFPCEGETIKGVLHLPDSPNPPLVVGSHGLEGNKKSAKQTHLAEILPEAGIAFFRFDHRGCGESSGDFLLDTSLEKRALDMTTAVAHILSLKITGTSVALFGSSFGGSTAIETWEKLSLQGIKPKGIVLCAAPVKSGSIKNIPLEGDGTRPALPLSFFKNNLLFDISEKTKKLHSVLVFHGEKDEVVPVENAAVIARNAMSPKKLILQKNGDHRMSIKKDQQEFGRETLNWYQNCFKSIPV